MKSKQPVKDRRMPCALDHYSNINKLPFSNKIIHHKINI